MTLPPFPSQDLAKLVLGYLAEEQLMTAYDEFLQASPYLDALRNEYDRIFMTSLKNILAEYRAVKIFVETCKPFLLRKKLIQCTNLLDVVKFLVTNIDVNKLQSQDITLEKNSLVKQNTLIAATRSIGCDICSSINLSSCTCKSRQSSGVTTASCVEISSLETSVETTALEDLPGNHLTTRKKHLRVLDKEETSSLETSVSGIVNYNTKQSNVLSSNDDGQNSATFQAKSIDSIPLGYNSMIKADTSECTDKIEEFNNIYKKVCKNKCQIDTGQSNVSENIVNKMSNTTTFQDFASGVCGNTNRNVPAPDSSTSENQLQNVYVGSKETSNVKSDLKEMSKGSIDDKSLHSHNLLQIRPKPMDQKIKIISDVKVDKPFNAMSNATSTPLMQTILINGTPAYRQKGQLPSNYTKDEIMAMPTIIVVPVSGPPKSVSGVESVISQTCNQVTTKCASATRLLGPLIIDVSSSSSVKQPSVKLSKPEDETGLALVKTIDVMKMSSVPKDNTVTCAAETNTPQVLPPIRKSSSTPRRNSHIRVLDFTTPRRILPEIIQEEPPKRVSTPIQVAHNSPNVPNTTNEENKIIDMSNVTVHKIETSNISVVSNKQNDTNNVVLVKRKDWDADLRALAVGNARLIEPIVGQTKTKSKTSKKKTVDNFTLNKTCKVEAETKKSKPRKKLSPKNKKSKRKEKVEQDNDDDALKISELNRSVKPTINIISGDNKYTLQGNKKGNECVDNQNKSNDEANETPEAERIALQNVIGAKLNISDLLETPYKQALYDIQMETPKFLGPDLPGEPVSDIKIMNIPTPRFFDTPKPAQATPSSYSSRPTDYSSGGSYYKPDDHYIPIPDLECPVTSSKPDLKVDIPNEIESDIKKTRPVRKCTKNVSYFRSNTTSNKSKEKEVDEKIEIVSSGSDTTIVNSSFESKVKNVKLPRSNKSKSKLKTEDTRKRLGSNKTKLLNKTYKSPIKKPITFMKIKPRRPTPIKESLSGKSKRKSDYSQNSSSKIKKKSGKEKNIDFTPVVTSAPTKSRRKSSTPRKLHCTKTFNSESSGHGSPETNDTEVKEVTSQDQILVSSHDSDTEQLALRWSDDGSQDSKPKEKSVSNESEDITKIQEYIETTHHTKPNYDTKGSLHVDLIKRGFDAETAKIIERDLLDTPPHTVQHNVRVEIIQTKRDDSNSLEKSIETDTSCANELQIDQDAETEEEEIQLSVHECNEGSNNYIVTSHDNTKDTFKGQFTKLKDKFSMEVCIDDGVAIRLRATDYCSLFEQETQSEDDIGCSFKETEVAVSSITSNFEKLYTPMKDQMKATCYEIFDSTLTSLDTPLKPHSPHKGKEPEIREVEIVIEDDRDTKDIRKRKRSQRSNSPEVVDTKKTKSEAQYLLGSTDIQNFDIETVLIKLHGP